MNTIKSFDITDIDKPFATEQGRNWLISHLKMGAVKVTFVKKDGSERTMLCTLSEDAVPPIEKKTDRVKASNEEVLPVYDLDAKGWRSFRLDSILTVAFDL